MTEHPEQTRTSRSVLAWYGVLGGPVAWTVELLAGYGTEEAACSAGSTSSGLVGNADSTVGAITVATLLVALGAGLAARAIRHGVATGELPDPRGRVAFMARVGMIASPLFALAIVLSGIPIFALDACRT
jgi:hypothetical protein